jgi:diadenylate cyclase
MTLDGMIDIFRKLLDVVIVWLILYYVLKSLRKNVKMILLFKGIIFVVVIKIISDLLHLTTIDYILRYILEWGPLALIIIFQPEIRNVLESIGRSQLLGRHKVLTVDEREKMVYEISQTLEYLKKTKIGALIIIERDDSLTEYIEKSKKLYADISSELLISIFFPNNPLHDGGVIIQGDKITSAGAVFPTSENLNISKRLGTRHRAALGIAEETDCIAIIVSEETGRLSVAMDSELHYNLTIDDIKLILLEGLKPKKSILIDDEDNEEEELDDENNSSH